MISWWKSLSIQTQISIIVVLISIVSLIVNTVVSIVMKRNDIRANIVSNARIKWISEVRLLIAEYIKKTQKIIKNVDLTDTYTEEKLEAITRELGDDILDLNYILDVITLYFSDNKENNEVIKSLNEVYSSTKNYYIQAVFPDDETTEKIDLDKVFECNNQCIIICRNYLKKEWEKAKKGQ